MKIEKSDQQIKNINIAVFDPSGKTGPLLEQRLSNIPINLQYFRTKVELEEATPEKLNYDLMIIDLDENESLGFEIAQEIRQKKVLEPEIVFASSNPSITIYECHQAGAFGLLSKPFDLQYLKFITHQVQEHRNHIRFDIEHFPGVIKKGDARLISSVKNIGRGGFFMELQPAEKLPQIGEVLDFTIEITVFPDFILEGRGIVRWSKQSEVRGIGVEFVELPEESHKLINIFVELFKIRAFVPVPEIRKPN